MLLKNKRFTAKVVFIIITAFVLIFSIILISETKTHYYVFLADDDTECIINNVPYVTQENVLPTGCESACAVMVLQYNGLILQIIILIKKKLFMTIKARCTTHLLTNTL